MKLSAQYFQVFSVWKSIFKKEILFLHQFPSVEIHESSIELLLERVFHGLSDSYPLNCVLN